MYFEKLQPIEWSSKPTNWVTPYDMRPGERLLPYQVYLSILFERLAPIVSILNNNIIERVSSSNIALELGVVTEMTAQLSESLLYPVRVGNCNQSVYGTFETSSINPKIYEFGQAEYSKSLDTIAVLNNDDTFTISINDYQCLKS
jgi:hypothetical protein